MTPIPPPPPRIESSAASAPSRARAHAKARTRRCASFPHVAAPNAHLQRVSRCAPGTRVRAASASPLAIPPATAHIALPFASVREVGARQVVRVKNYMARGDPSPVATARLRAVVVNLRVSTELSEMFKLNWHVCEVQLLLRNFADLLAAPLLHARYRRYRSFPRAVIGDLAGCCDAAETQTPRTTARSNPSRETDSFGYPYAKVFDCNNLQTIEFPSIESDAINQANLLLFPGQLPLQSAEEDKACLLAPQSAVPFLPRTQSSSACYIDHRELSLLHFLFCRQNFQGQLAQHVPTVSLQVGSDSGRGFPVEGGGLGDLEFLKMVINGGMDGERIVGADPIVVLSLWEAYVWQVMETNSMLQSLLMKVDSAMKQCSSSSVMFTSAPLVTMMTKKVFLVVLLVFMAYSLCFFVLTWINASLDLIPVDAVRVTILDINTRSNVSAPVIASLIPLAGRYSCDLNSDLWKPGPAGAGNFTLAGTWVSIKGYRLETTWENLSGTEPHHMIGIPEGRSSNGIWQSMDLGQVGFYCDSVVRAQVNSIGQVRWHTKVSVDKDWMWYVRFFATALISTLGFGLTLILAILRKQWLACQALLTTLWLYAISMAVAMVGYLIWAADQPSKVCYSRGIKDSTLVLPFTVLAAGLTTAQHKTVGVLLLFAGLHMTGSIIRYKAMPGLLGYPEDEDLARELFIGPQGLALCFAVGFLIFRRRAMLQASALVHADFMEYNSVWQSLLAQAGVQNTFDELEVLLAGLQCNTSVLRQLHSIHRTHSDCIKSSISDQCQQVCAAHDSGPVHLRLPIKSLDQVFFQAKCINPVFLRKVQKLAEASCGGGPSPVCVTGLSNQNCADTAEDQPRLMGASQFVFQLASHGEGSVSSNIVWGSVKSVNRSIEKIIRVYRGDVSRLVDVCRKQIIFERPEDLLACTRLVLADPELHIVRVKNRFERSYNSALSAGYRDVCFNLHIVTSDTQRLGLDNHVCELQLSLLPIACIKVSKGHHRYTHFRDIRGE